MAHLFLFFEAAGSDRAEDRWKAIRLDPKMPSSLDGLAGEPRADGEASRCERAAARKEVPAAAPHEPSRGALTGSVAALLACSAASRAPMWALLAGPLSQVAINGSPVLSGIRVLNDRDRIVADFGGRVREFYFSSEEPAAIEPFPGPEPVVCPRCKNPIEPGEPAVRCPACGFWHHEIHEIRSGDQESPVNPQEDRAPGAQAPVEPGASARSAAPPRERGCWTYLPGCASCGASTALDGKLAWTPDEL